MASSTPMMAMAAASLSSASPSTKRINRAGAPTSRNTAITAEGSVVAIIAPSSRHVTMPNGVTAAAASPITPVATTTATMASIRIGAASGAMLRTSTDSAA
jgi:hypothetical protein